MWLKLWIACVFICGKCYRDTNTFERLYSNGSNAHLIDHSRPTSVFVHGFSDSFNPKRNSKCSSNSSIFFYEPIKFKFQNQESQRKWSDFLDLWFESFIWKSNGVKIHENEHQFFQIATFSTRNERHSVEKKNLKFQNSAIILLELHFMIFERNNRQECA